MFSRYLVGAVTAGGLITSGLTRRQDPRRIPPRVSRHVRRMV
jgi:hypothetical protein